MEKNQITQAFNRIVKNKFNVYNSLFLSLPYPKVNHIGMLIPLLYEVGKKGLEQGKDPEEIMDTFFVSHTDMTTDEEKIDFMLRVIQYVERQVVLYDSVEDSAFSELTAYQNDLSLKDYINASKNKHQRNKVLNKLSDFSVRIVFTAHPTQFYPPSVLDIIARLRKYIRKNSIDDIDITLQQLGLTSFINKKKPTPLEEARNVIYFLTHVYYDSVGELYHEIKRNLPADTFHNPNMIQLGFWPGGDRDGNPFVTFETTLAVANELRMSLMKQYHHDLTDLKQKLTFSGVEEIITELSEAVYKAMFDSTKTVAYDKIIDPLHQVSELLKANYNSLYLEQVERLTDKVHIFKIHFAALDIRQNHIVHQKAVENVLRQNGLIRQSITELSPDALLDILVRKNLNAGLDSFNDPVVKDTVINITQLKEIQHKNGEEGCNRYIISHAEDIYSVLFVYALLRWYAWNDEPVQMDIIPLFESIDGMANSGQIMRQLFKIPEYRKHITNRKEEQTIMLGFSDGTKDGGYLQANWSIFKTKENLSEVCDEYGIKAIFFDGRGGPPARGGGKTHRFYAAQSNKIANHAIQLTIQGQTISSKYGTRFQFIHNSEQLLTAGLANSLYATENEISEKNRALIEELALISYEKYTALKNHPVFVPYLERKSTLKYYGQTNIGSRPTKRGNGEKLDLEDLRAIPFVGSWSQLRQNVPGYYGIGSALNKLAERGRLEDLKRLFAEVPFFRALIENSMVSLIKSNFNLTRYILKDKQYKAFWEILFKEYELSEKMVLEISGYKSLMEEEPVSKSSIAIREEIVLPLLIIQQTALQKIEKNSALKEDYEKIVMRSLYGNINASRNSA
ncbi:MAG: phosphoenolpyruvate carboxylase [Bacteroidales bacterium]|nr:phosphoenolpyruvate carboxylase [Bacteroidales bacterium]